MRRRSLLGWAPLALFVLLSGGGSGLVAWDLGRSGDVLIIGTANGSQIGMVLVLLGAAAAGVALLQAAVLSAYLRRRSLRVLVRTAATVLLVAGLPLAYLLLVMAGFSTVNEYQRVAVAGHSVVVQTTTWHHRSRLILEGDGLVFRPVPICGDGLSLDGYDPFANSDYVVASRGGHDVLRFPQRAGGPYSGEAVLGLQAGEDVSAFCG